jgi:hypothetical protein
MEASYVAESMSSMSATDGEEMPDRYGSMLLRQVCLEGLDIVVFARANRRILTLVNQVLRSRDRRMICHFFVLRFTCASPKFKALMK